MAIKTSARTNKHRPTSLGRSVSFGEERFGATRITRPGNSPSSPPHKRYPITTPLTDRWSRRVLTPRRTVYNIVDKHAPRHEINAAWIVTIVRKENGDIEFLDGASSWHKLQHNAEKRVTRSSSALLSSSTAEFNKTLPALLQNGNLTSASRDGDFQFRNTKGWRRVAKETTRKREHIETWVYEEPPESLSLSTKQQKVKQQRSNPDSWSNSDVCVDKTTGHVTFRTLASFRKISESSESGAALFLHCNEGGPPPPVAICLPQTARSNTTKARKNRKAREKKVQEKRNVGKRNKVPYIPRHVFEEKTLTRSRARLHHVHAKEFYALP